MRSRAFLTVCVMVSLMSSMALGQAAPFSFSGKRLKRIVVRNAMMVDGSGKPAAGPFDIVLENDIIKEIASLDPVAVKEGTARRPAAGELDIDATGKYVLPGLINLHGHTQDERAGKPMPVEYVTKMWLACGITTVRDAWANPKVLEYSKRINAGTLVGPRIFPYGGFPGSKSKYG
ncbi:MAG: hypothetical protein IPO41_09385 [Acidobacteria bacterium]|nr:hypothetical protein [Acidobacteriota bacterium]